MTSKIGPHIIGPLSPFLDTIEQWQPGVVLVMDPTEAAIADLRRRVPNATIIGRIYVPDAELEGRIRAGTSVEVLLGGTGLFTKMVEMPEVNFWQINNEILQTSVRDIALLDEFSLRFMGIITEHADSIGTNARAAVGCFGVGQPDLPTENPMAYWRGFYRSLKRAADDGHILLIHAYGAPSMREPSPTWYLHRFEEMVWPQLPTEIVRSLRYVYGEYGIDGGVLGQQTAKQGWRRFTNAKGYVDQIVQAERRLWEYPLCLGACLFTCGQFGDWQSFDIWPEVAKELAKRSYENQSVEPEPIEEPDLAKLAEACRWYSEDITRRLESGMIGLALDLLTNTLTPKLYELENKLKP